MKPIRLIIVCLNLMVFASYYIAAQTQKATLYYNFEGTGDTIIDKSSKGNDGALFNGANRVDDAKFGKGIQFDGVDDYAKLPTKGIIEEPGAGTVAVWAKVIKTQGGGGFPVIFAHDVNMIHFAIRNGNWWVHRGDENGDAKKDSGVQVKVETWYHLALTWNNRSAFFYLDGDSIVKWDYPSRALLFDFFYLSSSNGGEHFFNGIIDELKIFKGTLTQAQVKDEMNEGIKLAVFPKGKLTAVWGKIKFNSHIGR